MSERLVQGLTYSPLWVNQGEGPVTVAEKVLAANHATRDDFTALMRKGRVGRAGTSNVPHTGLYSAWMQARPDSIWTTLTGRLAPLALDCVLGRHVSLLASAQRFRYCEQCLAGGYQARLCQVDALVRCPIHASPILDCCRSCGCPTSMYQFTGSGRGPLTCPDCGMHLAPAWDDTPDMLWSKVSGTEKYAELERCLAPLRDIEIVVSEGWDAYATLITGNQQRTALFAFFVDALELALPADTLEKGVFDSTVKSSSARPLRADHRSRPHSPKAVKSLARQVWQNSLVKRLGDALDYVAGEVGKGLPRGAMLEWVGSGDVEALAVLLWVHRFGSVSASNELRVMPSDIKWVGPLNWSLEDFGRYFGLAYLAELRLAKHWCTATKGLTRQDDRWRELTARYAALFRSMEPAGMIVVKVPSQGESVETPQVTSVCGLASSYVPIPAA